jgi:hypothetical protein
VLVFPQAHLPIRRVDAGGNDIDDDLARTDYRTWKIAVLEDFRSTVPFNESCFHFTFTPTVVRTPRLVEWYPEPTCCVLNDGAPNRGATERSRFMRFAWSDLLGNDLEAGTPGPS